MTVCCVFLEEQNEMLLEWDLESFWQYEFNFATSEYVFTETKSIPFVYCIDRAYRNNTFRICDQTIAYDFDTQDFELPVETIDVLRQSLEEILMQHVVDAYYWNIFSH